MYKDKEKLQYSRKFALCEYDYKTLTKEIGTYLNIGKVRQKEDDMKDKVLIKKFADTHKLDDKTKIFYTDGSKTDVGKSTGVGIVSQRRVIPD